MAASPNSIFHLPPSRPKVLIYYTLAWHITYLMVTRMCMLFSWEIVIDSYFPKSSLCHKLTVKVTVQAKYFRCSPYGRIIYKKVLFIRNFWNFFYERFNKRFQFSILVWGDLWFSDKKTKNISKYYLCTVLMK